MRFYEDSAPETSQRSYNVEDDLLCREVTYYGPIFFLPRNLPSYQLARLYVITEFYVRAVQILFRSMMRQTVRITILSKPANGTFKYFVYIAIFTDAIDLALAVNRLFLLRLPRYWSLYLPNNR